MKGQVGNGTRNRWLHFGGVPDDRLDPGIFWRILHRCEIGDEKTLGRGRHPPSAFLPARLAANVPKQRSFHVQSGILALKLNTTEECSGSRPLSTRLMISCSYWFKKKKKKPSQWRHRLTWWGFTRCKHIFCYLFSQKRVDCVFAPLNYSLSWPQRTARKCLLALWRHGHHKIANSSQKSRLLSELAPLCSINQLCLCVQFISQRNSRSCPTLVRDSYACGSIWGYNSAAEEQLPVREGGKGPLELRTYGPGFAENVAPG